MEDIVHRDEAGDTPELVQDRGGAGVVPQEEVEHLVHLLGERHDDRGPQDVVQEMSDTFEERRDLVLDGLEDMGLEVPTPKGAFYAMPKVPEGWVDECISRGVVVVPGEAFGEHGEGYARISYATSTEELEEALDVMRAATDAVR